MAVLNENMQAPPWWGFRSFIRWKRVYLVESTRMFKFTHHQLFDNGKTTPWWAFVEPQGQLAHVGLDAQLAAARANGSVASNYIRDVYAVMFEWNSLVLPSLGMLRIQYARLVKPVFAFHGQVRADRR